MAPANPMGFDAKKVFEAERQALELVRPRARAGSALAGAAGAVLDGHRPRRPPPRTTHPPAASAAGRAPLQDRGQRGARGRAAAQAAGPPGMMPGCRLAQRPQGASCFCCCLALLIVGVDAVKRIMHGMEFPAAATALPAGRAGCPGPPPPPPRTVPGLPIGPGGQLSVPARPRRNTHHPQWGAGGTVVPG